MNDRRVQVVNAQQRISQLNQEKAGYVEQIAGIDNQIAEQQNIVDQSKNEDATDRAQLEGLDSISLRIKNKILFLHSEDILVIPFSFE